MYSARLRRISGPCCLAIAPDSLLWVRDGGNARYNAYRLGADDAEFVTSIRMQHGDANRWAPLTFDAEGNLVDIGTRPVPDGGLTTYRLHLARDGAVTREQRIEDPPTTAVPVHTVQIPIGDVPFGGPERKQPLRHLDFDANRNLWVFLEAAEDAPRQADIYDPAGTHIRTVSWMERVESLPLVLRPDALLGVVRDSLDLPYVTRLRVR